jgi:Uma2 family endonuclease
MTALTEPWMSPDEYLEGELRSEVRHEYVGGRVYAMAGASEEHNVISGNIYSPLHEHLRGHRCRAFMNDMKVLPRPQERDLFYYPDIMVACHPAEASRYFREHPSIIVEVLSPETERIDRTEKFAAYTAIPSLDIYVLVEQSRIEVTVFQRTGGQWEKTILTRREDVLRFASIDFAIPLARVYEDVAV